jgi:hypothetical protein
MADIKLNDLQLAGSEFFADNEGYLSDLSEDELSVWGGTGGGGGDCGCGSLVNVSDVNVNVSDILNHSLDNNIVKIL